MQVLSQSPLRWRNSKTQKRKAGGFKFIQFEERLRKVPFNFRDGLVWTVSLTVEIKLCLYISLAYGGLVP